MAAATSRLLALLELLQLHGTLSGSELARRLEVDVRTVRRYIVALEAMGIPVTAEPGRAGGYALVAGFKLPPMMFTADEALALALGLVAAGKLGIGADAAAIETARGKLERVLPTTTRELFRAAQATLEVDLPAGRRTTTSGGVLSALAGATRRQRRVGLAYLAADGSLTSRSLDPYGIAYRSGSWFVAGFCHLRGDIRTFRVDRIRELRELADRFEPPRDFDTVAHLTAAVAAIPRAHSALIRLECDLPTAQRQIFATLGLLRPVAGGVRLLVETDDLAWLARELARFAVPFVIERPRALRQALAEHLDRLAAAAAPPPARRGGGVAAVPAP